MLLGAASSIRLMGVELLIGLEGFAAYQTQTNSECYQIYSGVRRWVLRSNAERETTQIIS